MSGDGLAGQWLAAWPQALATWSRFTQLGEPLLCEAQQAESEDVADGIAMIRFSDQRVVVNLDQVRRRNLGDLAPEILAHEVGHHIAVPGNLADHARCLAALRKSLSDLDADDWRFAANLYADLLINDRLKRQHGLRMDEVYRRLGRGGDRLWTVYLRTYEELWRLPTGELAGASDADLDADAFLMSRIVRHYAVRWLAGARRFAAIIHPYLKERQRAKASALSALHDLRRPAGPGDRVDGLTSLGEEEGDAELDAAFDEANGDPFGKRSKRQPPGAGTSAPGSSGGQQREPFEFGETLRALGIDLDRDALVARWYRERAMPHLLPFPTVHASPHGEPHPEGFATWEIGDDIGDLDLAGTLGRNGVLIPGITSLRRVEGMAPGREPDPAPVDLDIYIDCSGSMPDPSHSTSHLALAGTILTLSALRAGARVQATLWSGPRQFTTTKGFIRDETQLLAVVCGYLCGSTAFPLHVLRDTYANRRSGEPPVHIVVISDDGVDTMLNVDERGTAGASIATAALQRAGGGGTLVLNLPRVENWAPGPQLAALGWRIHAVADWESLTAFARAFVREAYQRKLATTR
jgi:hypothetical protein